MIKSKEQAVALARRRWTKVKEENSFGIDINNYNLDKIEDLDRLRVDVIKFHVKHALSLNKQQQASINLLMREILYRGYDLRLKNIGRLLQMIEESDRLIEQRFGTQVLRMQGVSGRELSEQLHVGA